MTTTTVTTTAKPLLWCGVAVGPLYLGVSLLQAATRTGFDLTRHPASLLSDGSLGFVQIANFLISGVLTIAAAAGIRRALGSVWGPRLLTAYGVSLICAGVFRADPQDGFPVGTPPGPPASVSWHGMLHLVAGSVGFLCFVAACFVLASRFGRGRAWYSRISGAVFLLGFVGVASGSATPAVTIGFWAAVAVAWTWLASTSAHLSK